jgi:hypothetical protein
MASIALAVLGAAPTIIQGITSLVHGIENIFGKGNGQAKKQAVLQAFQGAVGAYNAGLGAASAVDPKIKLPQISDDTIKAMSNLVDAIVAFYNAVGIFTHSS